MSDPATELLEEANLLPDVEFGDEVKISSTFHPEVSNFLYEDFGYTRVKGDWPQEFDPEVVEDSSDKFSFRCPDCEERVHVVQVENWGKEHNPVLKFHVACDKCKKIGTKKTYLRNKGKGTF